jgi:hypothetical protein
MLGCLPPALGGDIGLAAIQREVFAEAQMMMIFHHRRQFHLAHLNLVHHIDNVRTPAIAPAHPARHAPPPNLAPRPPTHNLTPREQQQLQTSTQEPTTRETHTLQPTLAPSSPTPPQQTTRLFSPSERKRKSTAKDKAIPTHDATRRILFPLVPHKPHHSRVDNHGLFTPLSTLALTTTDVFAKQSILISLAFFTWLNNFLTNTPYLDQLPPNNMFFSHPIAFLSRYAEVYNLHSQYISMQTAEYRRNKVDDVRKRAEYRKAHGLNEAEGVFGGWSARDDKSGDVVVKKTEEGLGEVGSEMPVVKESGVVGAAVVDKEGAEEMYTDFEGRRKPIKKWLGIW